MRVEPDAGTEQRSFLLAARTLRLLDERAAELAESRNALAQRLLDESLRTERHPLIFFRPGPGKLRRPALVGTRLHVTQVIETVRASENSVAAAAAYLDVPSRYVQAAVDDYADFKDGVDADLVRERELERREHERWERA